MGSAKDPVKKGQPWIKHSCYFSEAKRKLSKISDHERVEYCAFGFQRRNGEGGVAKLSQILSRDSLVSAFDLMWDRSDFVSGTVKEGNLYGLDRDRDTTQLPVDQKAMSLQHQKMCIYDPYNRSLFRWFNQTYGAKSSIGSCKENRFPFEARWETGNSYRWMAEKVVSTITRHYLEGAEIEKKKTFEYHIPDQINSRVECASGNADSCASGFVAICSEGHANPLLTSITESTDGSGISRSTDANYLLLLYKDRCANNKSVKTMSSKCSTDCQSEISSSGNNPDVDSFSNNGLLEGDREEDQQSETCYPSTETPTYPFVKQRHAFAGALAGVSVSLCLHPLDTVKTMVQSCRLEKSLFYTGRSIISERGLSGLYRGIASNIASSAPISALYTFTYETVKAALLPLFPKEYCSLTHCMAGGSASIATSFIFTPSERIKQQMQVSSHYRNCWTALVGIIQKGGLLSLYAGWSAVLCRNIPHSIIKFYVYENLKQMVLPSYGPCGQPTTLQTLICGGLAGSAAAFFTTPFDVVKTRLQTQSPGSRNQHNPGVYQTLQSIGQQEGLRGLYRGLIPRLVMYMSQGAIFFASYEFYKSVLSLEAVQPGSSALSGTKQKMEIAISH